MAFRERGGCPLCQCQRSTDHMPFTDIPVVRCADCGFLYSRRIFTDEAQTAYYAESFGGPRQQMGQRVNATVNAALLDRLINWTPGMRVLDVGAGYGFLLQALKDRHRADCVGVEPSRQEAAFAQYRLGVNVIPAMLSEAGLPRAHYDVVASFEVIEHVTNPIAFLCELLEYVRPGGLLLVMTDNFESDAVKALGAGFPKWIPHTHISHFGAATLEHTLTGIRGLKVEKALSFTPWEFWARNAMNRLRGHRPTAAEAFDLPQALAREQGGRYRLFELRRLLNAAWAKATASSRMTGAAMYFACRKAG